MGKFSGRTVGGGGRPIPGVTDENYLNLADDWTKSTGKAIEYAQADGKCFMLTPELEAEVAAWGTYFALKKIRVKVANSRVPRVKVMREWLATKGHYAVPSQWPWEFDQAVSPEMCR